MYRQKVICRIFLNYIFVGVSKVNDDSFQNPDPNPDPDPLLRGMDPRIRIRIQTKMSWIRYTGYEYTIYIGCCGTVGRSKNCSLLPWISSSGDCLSGLFSVFKYFILSEPYPNCKLMSLKSEGIFH